ncbi:hypothetical protein Tco_1160766 [Tanacetum coccineum]
MVNLPECSYKKALTLKKHNDLLKLMQLLMGLDDVYTPIRSQIFLTTEPLPNVKFAFATLSRDESHRISHSQASSSKNGQFRLGLGLLRSKFLLHNMLDHPSDQVIEVLKRKLNIDEFSTSDPCEGPYKIRSKEGFRFFLIIVDDCTRDVWVFLMK